MKLWQKKILIGLVSVLALTILYPVYLKVHQPEMKREAQLASMLQAQTETSEESLHLDEATKITGCNVQGSLPDHECTPGAVFENATKEQICVSGYSATVRKVSTSLKKKIFANYGIAYPVPYGSYEVDHLIPLALGGSNEAANLFPESAEPYPGFKEKDVVENYLHEEMCAGRIDLNMAQVQIANDWLKIYNNLSPKVIEDLKNKYRSWAN
jgi:hypothetical protein